MKFNRVIFFIYLTIFVILSSIFCHISYRQRPRPGDIKELDLIIPLQLESTPKVISPFGDTREYGRRLHTGIDLEAPRGTPIITPQDGKVVKTDHNPTAGNYVWIMDYREEYVYEFLHLQQFASGIAEGDFVKQGEIIGYVGNTGNARRTVAHLHFAIARLMEKGEVFGEKRYVDPVYLLPGIN